MSASALIALLSMVVCGCDKAPAGAPAITFDGEPSISVRLEVANTPESRAKGLMFRRTLAGDAGMLFIFPDEAPRAFWMKNTYIPLDMIFLDGRRTVVGVVPNAEPLTLQSRGVPQAAKYVLEVNGGFARGHGIRVGQGTSMVNLPQTAQ